MNNYFNYEKNRIYLTNDSNQTIAEITFQTSNPTLTVIDHTFVDGSLRGQGIADRLVKAVADRVRSEGKKVTCTCSYAKHWFEKHTEYSDIYQIQA